VVLSIFTYIFNKLSFSLTTMNHPIPLAFPDFIYTEPTLAPGGGAEVVSLANPAWFTNNGFSADFSCVASHPIPLIRSQFVRFTPLQSSLSSEYPVVEHRALSSSPFGFDLSPDQSLPPPPPSAATPDFTILRRSVPPPLPVYSASGFDLLTILARVATRPNPKIILGSVDLKCAFVVVDTRRFDHPIIYCSPSFCTLTGYSEEEVIGKNCRFLQAPAGDVRKGEHRKHTSQDAVAHLRKSLVANKECQTTIRNFRKDGSAFMNLLTVIPLSGGLSGSADDENEYVYHVGFQVDLAQQPNAILEKLNHGSYLVNYSTHTQQHIQSSLVSTRERKANNLPAVVMSKELRNLITDACFIRSIPLSTSTTIPPSLSASSPNQDDPVASGANHLLHLLLLEAAPDFIHVLSLKGSFLYVAPSVRRVLGYEPEEMVGKAVSDFAHPKDVVPLMRELKESSATGGPAEGGSHVDNRSPGASSPRTVNLLFRARTKMGKYIWVESRGRLHVEPGKGRKAIVLSGRARDMSRLTWDEVRFAGGLARGGQGLREDQDKKRGQTSVAESRRLVDQEVWGMISGHRKETLTFLSVGKGVEDVLGWSADELIGRNVMDIVLDEGARDFLGGVITNKVYHRSSRREQSLADGFAVRRVHCALRKKGNGVADVWFIIYRAEPNHHVKGISFGAEKGEVSSVPLVYQIRLVGARTILPDLASEATSFLLPPPRSYDNLSQLSSSSLAGAVPILNFTSSAPSNVISTPTTLDIFDELSISKGSSWQYELQQLRFANVRLHEELAALQVTFGSEPKEAADSGVADDSHDVFDKSIPVTGRLSSTPGVSNDEITARATTQRQYPSRLAHQTQRQEYFDLQSTMGPLFNRQFHPLSPNQQPTLSGSVNFHSPSNSVPSSFVAQSPRETEWTI
jgi:PAS domain S-box-containing protein